MVGKVIWKCRMMEQSESLMNVLFKLFIRLLQGVQSQFHYFLPSNFLEKLVVFSKFLSGKYINWKKKTDYDAQ